MAKDNNFKDFIEDLVYTIKIKKNSADFITPSNIPMEIRDNINKGQAGGFYDNITCTLSEGFTGIKNLIVFKDVETISSGAYANLTSLTNAILFDNIKTIGGKAFENCVKLKSVKFPSNLASIGSNCFSGCSALEIQSVDFPNTLRNVGRNAFWGTKWYNSQPNGAVYTGPCLYEYKGSVSEETLTLKDDTFVIMEYAIYNKSGIKELVGNGKECTVRGWAISMVPTLTKIKLDYDKVYLSQYSINSCANLEEVYIKNLYMVSGNPSIIFSGTPNIKRLYILNDEMPPAGNITNQSLANIPSSCEIYVRSNLIEKWKSSFPSLNFIEYTGD